MLIEKAAVTELAGIASVQVDCPDLTSAGILRLIKNPAAARRPARSSGRQQVVTNDLSLAAVGRHDPDTSEKVHGQPAIDMRDIGSEISAL